ITSVALFGGEATLSFSAFRDSPAGAVNATAYDTDLWDGASRPNNTHNDTQKQIGCTDCDGVMAVVPDVDFDEDGDDTQGGSITVTGFDAGFDWSIPRYSAVDDDGTQTITLFLDGSEVAASSGLGDASVEVVDVLATSDGAVTNEAKFVLEGSGGVDNIEICRSAGGVGRMTGGGTIRLEGMVDGSLMEVRFTHGFTLHCDILLSNNLEINWGGNQWHIEKESLENVSCTDDPDVSPEPPVAPFDTFLANAYGRLNGVDGSYIEFKLQDAGEPGGKNDKAGLMIWAPNDTPYVDSPVVSVPFAFTVGGNLQAHYDQPHGNKP
ncbi:MAG: hypothetical protein OER90_16675, partial [Gemmatimonadota bacterium]|nr:hypothetical protein [Gemmatimonadota bacterium]